MSSILRRPPQSPQPHLLPVAVPRQPVAGALADTRGHVATAGDRDAAMGAQAINDAAACVGIL